MVRYTGTKRNMDRKKTHKDRQKEGETHRHRREREKHKHTKTDNLTAAQRKLSNKSIPKDELPIKNENNILAM